MSSVNEILENLDFSSVEISVYKTLLESGEKTIDQIKEQVDAPSLLVVSTVDSLINKGLVSTLSKNNDKVFFAEHPDVLLSVVEQKVKKQLVAFEELKKKKTELEGIIKDEKPVVRFYEGEKMLKNLMEERQSAGDITMKVFYPVDQVDAFFKKNNLDNLKMSSKDTYKKISTIYNKMPPNYKSILNTDKYIPKPQTNFSSAIEIWDNKVHIVSFKDKPCGVLIEHEDIAHTFSEIFDLCIEGATQI